MQALVALCESRARPGHKFVVVNAHLFWNPAFADLKALQLAMLCYALKVHLQRWGLYADDGKKCPVVICADMNSQVGRSVRTDGVLLK